MKQHFIDAAARRLAVWEGIRQRPGCTLDDVYDQHQDMTIENIRVILRRMIERGSIYREGTYRRPIFYATEIPPETAEEAHDRTRTNLESARAKRRQNDCIRAKPQRYAKPEPWRTLNVDPEREPIRNQGGQGAVRRQFTIQSSADLL